MEVSTKTVAIKFEGRAGDGALIDGNLIRGTGASGGISISSDYHEIMIGVNSILVGRGGVYNISSGLRGTYLTDNLGIGVDPSVTISERAVFAPMRISFRPEIRPNTRSDRIIGQEYDGFCPNCTGRSTRNYRRGKQRNNDKLVQNVVHLFRSS